MRVQSLCLAILGVAGFITTGTAFAQGTPAATTPPPVEAPPAATAAASGATTSTSRMRLAINLVPMPYGSLSPASSPSETTAFAFGVMPAFDYLVHQNFFVGLGPTYTFNVKGSDAPEASKQFDILLRLGGGAPIAEKLQLFGYLAPGYSIIQVPSGTGDNPKGLTVGAHAGAIYELSQALFLNGTLGYQVGMQKVMSSDLKTQYLQVALGVGMRL
jgi:hypothetical protein